MVVDGTPYTLKGVRTVWSGGKLGDYIKELPIATKSGQRIPGRGASCLERLSVSAQPQRSVYRHYQSQRAADHRRSGGDCGDHDAKRKSRTALLRVKAAASGERGLGCDITAVPAQMHPVQAASRQPGIRSVPQLP